MGKKSKKYKSIKTETRGNTDKWGWVFFVGIILIVCLPLINFPPLFSPPDFGKAIIFRIIVSILLFFFIAKALFYPRNPLISAKSANKNLPLIALGILFLVFLLATILSQDWHHSLFDTPYRSGGSLNFFFYIIFAVLTFLTIGDEKKWQKIWTAAFIAGIIACLIGIIQRFGPVGTKFIIYKGAESISTLGGPIFFGNYIMLLSFLALVFGIGKKNWKWRLFYFLTFIIFIFSIVVCAEKRGPMVGLLAGGFWLIFFYPKYDLLKNSNKIVWLKILVAGICLFGLFGIYFLKTHPSFFLAKQPFLMRYVGIATRMTPSVENLRSRASSWQVAFNAIKEKPILGWGPENFSIAFDKHYDPSLPAIQKEPITHASWWDRAHDILVEYAICVGLLGLLIFLTMTGNLFWNLQKLKRRLTELSETLPSQNKNILLAHGIQATFFGYFAALLFSFDTVPTYIIFFLLVGFSLHLINIRRSNLPMEVRPLKIKWRTPIIIILFIILIWFIWALNIKPLKVNKDINIAIAQSEAKNCGSAINNMENLLKNKVGFLNDYLRLKYIIILDNCIGYQPENSLKFVKRAWEISKENTEIRPTYTRNWIFLGGYTNMLIEAESNPEKIKELKKEADSVFKKALELSPKRQEIYLEWIKTDLLTGDYQKAKEKSQKCLELNAKLWDCQWLWELSDAYLGNFEQLHKRYSDYLNMDKTLLLQLSKVFGDVKYYPGLEGVFKMLVSYEPNNPQYRASLAFVYKELGLYAEAKKEAEKILEIAPEAKPDVEKFLESLR